MPERVKVVVINKTRYIKQLGQVWIIWVPENMTVYGVKVLAASICSIKPEYISMRVCRNKIYEKADDSLAVKDLPINNDSVYLKAILNNNHSSNSKFSLLTSTNQLAPEDKYVYTEWFNRYSDGGVMTEKQLKCMFYEV